MNYERHVKECWLLSLQTDFISSEESDIDEDGKPIYCIKPLSWREESVNYFFSLLDEEHMKVLSPRHVLNLKVTIHCGSLLKSHPK